MSWLVWAPPCGVILLALVLIVRIEMKNRKLRSEDQFARFMEDQLKPLLRKSIVPDAPSRRESEDRHERS